MDRREINAELRRWRLRLGFSQREAAELLGVPKRTLQDWEQGRRKPRGFALKALSEKIQKEGQRRKPKTA
jgi:DNA-binding transcriptional regulator YiaG